jgi:D-alanyl-D-alanine carboxypeptidase (penicillin-binding protein 5/6)
MIRILSITLLCIITATSSYAKTTKAKKTKPHIQQPVQASLVVDAQNGEILHFSRASEKLYPASTVKMMTLYLAFDALESGKLSMDQMLPVSRRAQNMRPCKLGLIAGEKISVRDAIIGTQVKSANDAASCVSRGFGQWF